MPTSNQQTIAHSVYCAGVGLLTGEPVSLGLHPAPENAGIVFVRSDIDGDNEIRISLDRVADVRRRTLIANDAGAKINTVEHLLSACLALEIDNLRIEVSGPEIPAMDGSAQEFAALIQAAGLREQAAPARTLVVRQEVAVESGESHGRLIPDDGFSMCISISYPGTLIGEQEIDLTITPEEYITGIAPARTFGLASEVAAMREMGLARGGSLANAVIVDGMQVQNPEGLRYPDEFIRHKALDVLGDFAVCGMRIQGRYEAKRPGHHLNHKVMAALFADTGNYAIVPDAAPAQ